jgi:hypothetical protein
MHCDILATSNRLLAHHYTWGRQFLHFLKYLFAVCSHNLKFLEYIFIWLPSAGLKMGLFYPLMHCDNTAKFTDFCRITILSGDANFYISGSAWSPCVPRNLNFWNIFSFGFPALA